MVVNGSQVSFRVAVTIASFFSFLAEGDDWMPALPPTRDIGSALMVAPSSHSEEFGVVVVIAASSMELLAVL
jgi:hypothetical protein